MKNHPTSKAEDKDQALRDFMQNEHNKLISYLQHWVDITEAEDIFQDSVFKVFQLAEQNPQTLPFYEKLTLLTPMLYAVAKNKAISLLRHGKVEEKYRAEQSGAIHYSDKSIESQLFEDSQSSLLIEAINQLSPICRQVFVQRKINGKSHGQIADMLNISKKTIESHITKGLIHCREYMVKANKKLNQQGIKKVS